MSDSYIAVPTEAVKAVEFERFTQSISNIAAYNNINFADFKALQFEVAELFKKPEQTRNMNRVYFLEKKYSWAQRPVAILFATVIGET
jgi:hypothetical protein